MLQINYIEKLDSTLSYMAYEKSHSGGEEEVANTYKELKSDLEWVYKYFKEKQNECK